MFSEFFEPWMAKELCHKNAENETHLKHYFWPSSIMNFFTPIIFCYLWNCSSTISQKLITSFEIGDPTYLPLNVHQFYTWEHLNLKTQFKNIACVYAPIPYQLFFWSRPELMESLKIS